MNAKAGQARAGMYKLNSTNPCKLHPSNPSQTEKVSHASEALVAPLWKNPAYLKKNPARPRSKTAAIKATLRRFPKGRRSSATKPRQSIKSQPPFEPDQYKHPNAPSPIATSKKILADSVSL